MVSNIVVEAPSQQPELSYTKRLQLDADLVRLLAEMKTAHAAHSGVALSYNQQRAAQTQRKRELLTDIWDTYESGLTVGVFATKTEYSEHIGVSMVHIQRLVAAEREVRAGREPKKQATSCCLTKNKFVTVGDYRYRVRWVPSLHEITKHSKWLVLAGKAKKSAN